VAGNLEVGLEIAFPGILRLHIGMDMQNLKLTAFINLYSSLRVPLLAFITPRVVELTDERSVVRVRLDRRTRNHLGVMYFGALAMGAELSIALKLVEQNYAGGRKLDFIFKDFQCDFKKRADGHVHFVCAEVAEISKFISGVQKNGERHNATFSGMAWVPSNSPEPVMTYKLTLSVKHRG
jgi:hypothetical protein